MKPLFMTVLLVGILLLEGCISRTAAGEEEDLLQWYNEVAKAVEFVLNDLGKKIDGFSNGSCYVDNIGMSIGGTRYYGVIFCDMRFRAGTKGWNVSYAVEETLNVIAQHGGVKAYIWSSGYTGAQFICQYHYDPYKSTVTRKK
jgi:hypothetical protein